MATIIQLCVECELYPPHSRGLCPRCYNIASRGGFLSEYPTVAFHDDPESYIRWAFGYYPDLVADVAVEFNRQVVTD